MAGESQALPESTPDPSVLTTDAILRAVQAERDWVTAQVDVLRERLHGIDRATEVLSQTINRTPTEIQKEVTHLRELSNERFESVALQFKERDTRQEREARDNKVAVDAAFAAQKEAAAKQNESNTLAISKSEASTAETITKLAELFRSTTDALSDKIDDVKLRLVTIESLKLGNLETRKSQNDMVPWVVATVAIIAVIITVLTRLFANSV